MKEKKTPLKLFKNVKRGMLDEPLEDAWEGVTAGFWFVPTLMTAGGIGLFCIARHLDRVTGADLAQLPMVPIVLSGGTNGAAAMIGVIAGSLMTVMTTAFSVTIVALQLASSNYSPRLLRSFSTDRGVQTVLGGFVATFVYCLLVMRAISAYKSENLGVNPAISVTVAVLLALACMVLVIYFIQHATNLIQSSNIVGRAHRDTMRAIARLEDSAGAASGEGPPRRSGPGRYPPEAGSCAEPGAPRVVRASKSGYLRRIRADVAVRALVGGTGTTVVEFLYGPGCFISAGRPVVKVWCGGEDGLEPGGEVAVLKTLVLGRERSLRQDFAFGLRQLSDIALKALSPGLNDPTTAIQALDRLEAVFLALNDKALTSRVWEREVDGGRVVLKVRYPDFDELVGVAFDQVRRAALGDGQVAVLEKYLEVLDSVIREGSCPERGYTLWSRAFSVARMAPRQLPDPEDTLGLLQRAVTAGSLLLGTSRAADVSQELEELKLVSKDLRESGRVPKVVGDARDREASHPLKTPVRE